MRSASLILPLVAALGCSAHLPPATASVPLEPLPPIVSEEDYSIAQAKYETLPPGSPARPAARQTIATWLIAEARHHLAAQRPENAYEIFHDRLMPLWDVEELAHPAPVPGLLELADELERIYRHRGGHEEVLASLALQLALAPEGSAAAALWSEQWQEVMTWVHSRTDDRVVDDLETIVAAWPSPFVVEQLGEAYRARGAPRARGGGRGLPSSLAELLAHRDGSLGESLARLYLRVGRLHDALSVLQPLADQPGDEPNLRIALAKYLRPDATAQDGQALAELLRRDPPVAQRICRDAARRFPTSVEPQLCLGKLAASREQVLLAIQSFERATELAPSDRTAYEALARLYQAWLFQLVGEERVHELQPTLDRIYRFHVLATKRFQGQPLRTTLAGAYYEVGRGYYNAGRVADAVAKLNESLAFEQTPFAHEQLGVIALKRGQGREALNEFTRAEELLLASPRQNELYWRAKLRRGTGDAYELMGEESAAKAAWRQAVESYSRLLWSRNLAADDIAGTELELGRTLYLLGERERAIAALERAIDAAPDRGSTYADVIAFLVPRGERNEALDAYHRALGRSAVSEYLKVYCTLWILDLDRRSGQPEDALGRTFLQNLEGGKWYHELARWATGRESEDDLNAHAANSSHRAEAYFYLALRRLERGKLAEAQALWHRVLDTQMMAFFEFDMAGYYLRHSR